MTDKTVLILLAAYNGEKFIRAQIESIQSQTYKNWQLLIRDDGSSDSTINIVSTLADQDIRIRLVQDMDHNLGPCGNFARLMDYAMSKSDSPYVAFSDQDDIWEENKIELAVSEMRKIEQSDGGPILVYADLSVVDEQLVCIAKSYQCYMRQDAMKNTPNRMLMQCVVTGCTTLINRELLLLCLPFPPNVYMHDWWVGLIASVYGKMSFIDKSVMLYRQHGGNCLGAKRQTWIDYSIKIFNIFNRADLLRDINKSVAMADAFVAQFQGRIPQNYLKMFDSFKSFNQLGFWRKRKIILTYKLIRHGTVRNISLLLRV